MEERLTLQPADILAVRGNTWLSRMILKATGGPVSHVGLIISATPPLVLEALERVKTRPLEEALKDCDAAWVLQPYTLTAAERQIVVDAMCIYSAQTYGYGKLFLQGLNSVFKTRFFTRYALTSMPICSMAVAGAFKKLDKDFGQPFCCAQPFDIFYFAQEHPAHYRVTALSIPRSATGDAP